MPAIVLFFTLYSTNTDTEDSKQIVQNGSCPVRLPSTKHTRNLKCNKATKSGVVCKFRINNISPVSQDARVHLSPNNRHRENLPRVDKRQRVQGHIIGTWFHTDLTRLATFWRRNVTSCKICHDTQFLLSRASPTTTDRTIFCHGKSCTVQCTAKYCSRNAH